ncbi:hypothetical protein HDU84_002081 [Entophlyctis sp. JEL0112]|nr:hypothetical protein HDU84_002081 [Entophlyctis sp. JEL0112]
MEVHPRIVRGLKCVFWSLPIILYLGPLFTIGRIWNLGSPLEVLYFQIANFWAFSGAAITIGIEIIVLVSFVKYLRLAADNKLCEDKRLVIIAHYGISCVVIAFIAYVFFLLFVLFDDHIWFVAVCITFNGISISLILMKIALHRTELQKSDAKTQNDGSICNAPKTNSRRG